MGSSKSPPVGVVSSEPRPQVVGRTLGLSRAGGCPIIEAGSGPDRSGDGGEVSRLKVPDDTYPAVASSRAGERVLSSASRR